MMTESKMVLLYFVILIALGTVLLLLPFAWEGAEKLGFIDALFTVVSASCVTGLIAVDTASYTLFGQIVIMLLIQFGGLGLITFSTLYIVLPSRKISLKSRRIIKEYFLDDIEYDPVIIIRQIIIITFLIEFLGALVLYFGFYNTTGNGAFFASVFHSVSAFCNAGFSLYSNSLENYYGNITVNIAIMTLIVSGGLGFVVFRDIFKKLLRKNKNFALHTKIVVFTTGLLIIGSTLVLYIVEYNHYLKGFSVKDSILISSFQAITTRTAGFNTIPIIQMQPLSQFFIFILMFIGAAPGSTGGGIKVTTFYILVLLLVRKMDDEKSITLFKRKIGIETLFKTAIFVFKAVAFLAASILLTFTAESLLKPGTHIQLFPVMFECCSAFGTVGLSLGITAQLSWLGKLVIALTMLFGRIGLMIVLLGIFDKNEKTPVGYPQEEVLIG